MSWRKFLLIPRLATAGLRSHGGADEAWEAYWRDVSTTGAEGDVLWDGAGDAELAWWRGAAGRYLDPGLPVVDVGLRQRSPHPAAGRGLPGRPRRRPLRGRRRARTAGVRGRRAGGVPDPRRHRRGCRRGPRRRARPLQRGGPRRLPRPHRGAARARSVGARHDPRRSRHPAAARDELAGDLLGYLEHLGGRNGRLPAALGRLIDYHLPRPQAFGPAELAATFPPSAWRSVESGPVEIAPVRRLGRASGRTIPGFSAVLRTAGTVDPGRAVPDTTERS